MAPFWVRSSHKGPLQARLTPERQILPKGHFRENPIHLSHHANQRKPHANPRRLSRAAHVSGGRFLPRRPAAGGGRACVPGAPPGGADRWAGMS